MEEENNNDDNKVSRKKSSYGNSSQSFALEDLTSQRKMSGDKSDVDDKEPNKKSSGLDASQAVMYLDKQDIEIDTQKEAVVDEPLDKSKTDGADSDHKAFKDGKEIGYEKRDGFKTPDSSQFDQLESVNNKRECLQGMPPYHEVNSKKRISGKYIEKCWSKLEPKTLNSFEKILNISLNNAIEKYRVGDGSRVSKKMLRAQDALVDSWTSNLASSSFIRRLKATKVPPVSTLKVLNKSSGIDEELDVLNYDQLKRQSQFLETYLSAEYKQLSDLEKYYCELQQVHQNDLRYLREYEKTTKRDLNSINKESEVKQKEYGIHIESEEFEKNIKSENRYPEFNPNNDIDVLEIFNSLKNSTKHLSINLAPLKTLNSKLDHLLSFLESGN